MPKTTTYDPQDVNVIFNGVYITGFADGTFISASNNEDRYSVSVGSQGEVTRVRNANNTGRITLTLKQDSPSIDYLDAQCDAGTIAPANIIDLNNGGKKSAGGSEAWVVKKGNMERAKELGTVEYIIEVSDFTKN